MQHVESCPLYGKESIVDISIPGALALICWCHVKQATKTLDDLNPVQNKVIQPKKVQHSECELSSDQDMRRKIAIESHSPMTAKL